MHRVWIALGLVVLDFVADEVRRRQLVIDRYRSLLAGVPGLVLVRDPAGVLSRYTFAYRGRTSTFTRPMMPRGVR